MTHRKSKNSEDSKPISNTMESTLEMEMLKIFDLNLLLFDTNMESNENVLELTYTRTIFLYLGNLIL